MPTPSLLRRAAVTGALAVVSGLIASPGVAATAAAEPAPPGDWTIAYRGGPMQTPFLGLTSDDAGNLYGSAYQDNQIRQIDAYGRSRVIAGNGRSGDPVAGDALESPFGFLRGLASDARGTVFAADNVARRIVRITPSGRLSVVAGSGADAAPTPGPALASGLNPTAVAAGPDGSVIAYDYSSTQIVKITADGVLSILAGTGTQADPIEGPAADSPLRSVQGLAVDSRGTVYATDDVARRVIKISTDGRLSFVAGTGNYGTPTPGPALESDFQLPFGIAVDGDDNLFVAEAASPSVLKIDPEGRLSVIAGTGSAGDAAEGPATSTGLRGPVHLTSTGLGSLSLYDDGSPLIDLTQTPATTTARVSPTKRPRYGTPTPVDVTLDGARSGTVVLRDGSTQLDRRPLSAGSVRLLVPATALQPGRRTLTVAYLGNGASAPDTTTLDLTVARATSATSARLTRTRVSSRERPTLTVRTTATGVVATGRITVLEGRRVVSERTLGRDGTLTFSIPAQRPGRHPLRVAYAGSSLVEPSTSATSTLTAVR